MTPGARVAAAIEILEAVLAGEAAEKVLTGWARRHRFAGSKDRAAIRDHVFDALRRLRSAAATGGAMSGRGVMIGLLRQQGAALDTLFDGTGHAPPPLSADEATPGAPDSEAEALDCPDWLAPRLRASLGADFAPVLERLRDRAPVFLRVNLVRADMATAQARLAAEGIACRPHALSQTALEVTEGARRVAASAAYREGLVELQDAASQAVVDALPLEGAGRVLDYCAGGGGKALAIAGRWRGTLAAHDANPRRMADLPARAARAGVTLSRLATADLAGQGPWDVVLADAPCSGSGAWRRSPEGKWRLTEPDLARLTAVQDAILADAAGLVAPGGVLAYATCSLLDDENRDRIAAFLAAAPGWRPEGERRLTPLDGGDGFYVSVLRKPG
jgi:16S rRNA (cytosine967-C5)-methyltransferase